MIVDPGIPLVNRSDAYPPYSSGTAADVWIRGVQGDVWVGNVWPGACVFPNFLLNRTVAWWEETVRAFHDKVSSHEVSRQRVHLTPALLWSFLRTHTNL